MQKISNETGVTTFVCPIVSVAAGRLPRRGGATHPTHLDQRTSDWSLPRRKTPTGRIRTWPGLREPGWRNNAPSGWFECPFLPLVARAPCGAGAFHPGSFRYAQQHHLLLPRHGSRSTVSGPRGRDPARASRAPKPGWAAAPPAWNSQHPARGSAPQMPTFELFSTRWYAGGAGQLKLPFQTLQKSTASTRGALTSRSPCLVVGEDLSPALTGRWQLLPLGRVLSNHPDPLSRLAWARTAFRD